MVTLSDQQLASLLEEIAAAMRVGSPILDSMRRLQTARLGRVASAAGQIADGLDKGLSISTAIGGVLSRTHKPVVAAVEAAQQSGDPELLDRMATVLNRRWEIGRDTRFAWFYPGLLAVLGYIVGAGLMAPIVLGLEGRDMQWPEGVVTIANWLVTYGVFPLLLIIFFWLVVTIWPVSRRRLPAPARRWLFCRSLADQLVHDVPEGVAIRTAAEMSGQQDVLALDNASLDSREVARIIAPPPSISDQSALLDNEKHALIARLRYLASIYGEQARRRSVIWSRLVPRVSMVVIGGGMVLSYAFFVIAPVYAQVARW